MNYYYTYFNISLYCLSLIIFLTSPFLNAYDCAYTCTSNILEEIYPNQNMCILLESIPLGLKSLAYGMYPNCDIYNTNRFNFNKRFNVFPKAILVPRTEEELLFTFTTLVKNKLPFSVRSAGHCFEPGSLSNDYIIDLRNFDQIIPNIPKGQVYIGAGSRLGPVISALGKIDYAIPTGTCSAVGVSGLALEGGIGYLARPFGVTSDSIVSIRLLTAEGTIINVTADKYPDLFWALCGAGANAFGIVIGFTFKMHYVPIVSLAVLRWDWDPVLAKDIFKTWQKWITTIPQSVTSEIIFSYRTGTSRVTIQILKVGSEPLEWQKVFGKFNPIVDANYRGNYTGAAAKIASTPTPPFLKAKSKFLFKPLAEAGMKPLLKFFSKLQNEAPNIRMIFFFGSALGGAISRPNPNSSYFPRDAFAWNFQFAYWFYQEQEAYTLCLLDKMYRKLEPYTSPYSYSNLVDYDLGLTYLHAYYGDNVDRLIKIKNTYDPKNIFTWRQGIPLKPLLQPTIKLKHRYYKS